VVKILRAKNVQSPKTPKGATANPKSGSWHDESQLTRAVIKTKKSVRRLFASDPNTSNTFTPVMEEFSDNKNPRYDPSRAPGSVTVLDGTPPRPEANPNAGHQKVIQQTNQMKTGGKTLKRRP
jgi:hypothetical protein